MLLIHKQTGQGQVAQQTTRHIGFDIPSKWEEIEKQEDEFHFHSIQCWLENQLIMRPD